jgi:UDP-2-acetamido-2,6-beta-L-arabino-hexul-4-ose reductase
MDSFVKSCDVVIHAASVIRNEDESYIFDENVRLVKSLLEAFARTNSSASLIFLSSTHKDSNSAYGLSKKISEELCESVMSKLEGSLLVLALPGIFGENQNPHFNSVVPTFCVELLEGLVSKVNQDAVIELLHVSHVGSLCNQFISQKQKQKNERIQPTGVKISVGDLYQKIKSFTNYSETGIIPNLESDFETQLFNTYRYYAIHIKGPSVFNLFRYTDDRGVLFEIVKSNTKGQVFYSTSKPDVIRGNHFHTRKIERFCVVKGEGKIDLKNIFTGEEYGVSVNGEVPVAIDMPTYYLHSLKNTGLNEIQCLFWTSEFLDKDNPDTYSID